MREKKKQQLRDAGYRVTDTKEFLGLSDSEAALIETEVQLYGIDVVDTFIEAYSKRDHQG